MWPQSSFILPGGGVAHVPATSGSERDGLDLLSGRRIFISLQVLSTCNLENARHPDVVHSTWEQIPCMQLSTTLQPTVFVLMILRWICGQPSNEYRLKETRVLHSGHGRARAPRPQAGWQPISILRAENRGSRVKRAGSRLSKSNSCVMPPKVHAGDGILPASNNRSAASAQ